MEQPGPGRPVPGFQASDEALHQPMSTGHPGKLPHAGHRTRSSCQDAQVLERFRRRRWAMIRVLDGLPAGVLGFEASGKLTADDYTQVLAPALEAAARAGKIRIPARLQ